MTGRSILHKRVRRILSIAYLGTGIFALSIVTAKVLHLKEFLYVGIAGFAVAFVTMFYAQYWGIRCPCCRGNLAFLALYGPGLSLDRRAKFCPYCGAAFDAECHLPEHARPVEPA